MNFYSLFLLFSILCPSFSANNNGRVILQRRYSYNPSLYSRLERNNYYSQNFPVYYNTYSRTPLSWQQPQSSFPVFHQNQNHLNWKGGYTAPAVFPMWNYNEPALQNEQFLVNQCYLQNGQLGTCVKLNLCPSFLYFTAPYQFSERFRLAQCGYTAGDLKICCPANLVHLEKKEKTVVMDKKLATLSSANSKPQNLNTKSGAANTGQFPVPINNQMATDKINKDKVNYNTISILASKAANETDSPVLLNPSNMNDFNFSSPDANQVCGLYDSSLETWPWLVSIGHMDINTSKIEWICLGSLITREHVLTTAHCLERSPLVILIGKITSGSQYDVHDTVSVAELLQYPKYNRSELNQNIGLIRLSIPVVVKKNIIPVCFPFNAGVLDIIPFADSYAKTTGYKILSSTEKTSTTKKEFAYAEYRILNHTMCSKIFKNPSSTSRRFPDGIYRDIMCGFTRKHSPLCVISGAPLVLYDQPSNSFVVIGVSIGDPTCSEYSRQIVTFSRLNSFSSWIREQIGVLPHPPDCYF